MRFALLALASWLWVMPAWAIDASITSSTVTINYTEPSDLVDERPLTDLIYTTIKPVLRDRDGQESPLPPIQMPASSPNGGGAISHQFQVSTQDDFFTVLLTVTATRDTGAESIPSAQVTVIIDRVPPSPPQ